MYKDFMKAKKYLYQKSYGNNLLRGIDLSPRSWLTQDIAKNWGGANKKLLDIGCGNAYKTLMLANDFASLYGLDPSPDMLKLATTNIKNQNAPHVFLIKGIGDSLPFQPKQFDVITAILTWWSPKEIHKVMKPDGVFLCESLGPEDKTTFTKYFGQDDLGWRGANVNTTLEQIQETMRDKLSPFFQEISFQNIAWQTAYTEEGLLLLLKSTKSTVRNFCESKDHALFTNAINSLASNGKIILTQNRLVTVATNPR